MTDMTASSYDFLKARFAQIAKLEGASGILGKDAETVMAKGSGNDRIQQLVAIGETIHMLITDPKVEEALHAAKDEKLDTKDARNLELMHHTWVHEAGLPSDLAAELSRVAAEGEQIHTKYHGTGDWDAVRDWYAYSFKVAREAGQVKQEKLGLSSPYEALLDKFSPGMRVAQVDAEFKILDTALRPMIREALELQKSKPAPLAMSGPFALAAQAKFGRELAEVFGFDFNRGVHYAIKGHPSMGGSADDARITTRLDEHDLIPGIYATIHETGHAVYEQNLPEEWRYQRIGTAMGMQLHESQSMIMEYQAAMTYEFLEFLSGKLQALFDGENNPSMSAANIKAMQTHVEPSFIRIDADEMTYPMHILLRYELESKMVSGELTIDQLPDAWSDGLFNRLGIRPTNPSEGCMQDVHWPVNYVGYFPAYTFGAMGAAQLFQSALAAYPGIRTELGQGSSQLLRKWLSEYVHGKGSMLDMDTLFTNATGAKLNAKPYLNHLSQRYLGRPYVPQ